MSLVSEVTGEIITVDVTEVHGFWNFAIRDVLSVFELVHVFLSLGESSLEFFVTFNTKFFLLWSVIFYLLFLFD